MLQTVFFIVLATLLWFSWYIFTFDPAGGDKAVGQAWSLIFSGAIFAVSAVLLFFLLARQGSFYWLGQSVGLRTILTILFCCTFITTVFFAGVFSVEWHGPNTPYPVLLHLFARSGAYLWIGILVLVPFYFLIMSPQHISKPMGYLLKADVVLCGIFCLLLFYGWARENYLRAATQVRERQAVYDEYHLKNLQEISEMGPDQDIYGLLSHSYILRPEDIREAALQKIYQRPDWENEVLAVLEDRDQYIESYYYLSGNRLDHPGLFKEPLRQSIRYLAEDSGLFLRETNNIQDWSLDHLNIAPMLQAIDHHFQGEASFFVPEVKNLYESIVKNTPEQDKKVKVSASRAIQSWLRDN